MQWDEIRWHLKPQMHRYILLWRSGCVALETETAVVRSVQGRHLKHNDISVFAGHLIMPVPTWILMAAVHRSMTLRCNGCLDFVRRNIIIFCAVLCSGFLVVYHYYCTLVTHTNSITVFLCLCLLLCWAAVNLFHVHVVFNFLIFGYSVRSRVIG